MGVTETSYGVGHRLAAVPEREAAARMRPGATRDHRAVVAAFAAWAEPSSEGR
ncbi:hypothetical protein [Streptomyces sp. NPDC096013]|uniref:hypothetical protein n=1 Tax=Streptomyces sp. NPDC096013 TaxID=3366069 RepID=UPI00381C686D